MNKTSRLARTLAVLCAPAAALCCIAGCPTAPSGTTDSKVSFANQVQPILTPNCASCHQPGGFADNAGVALDLRAGQAYAELLAGADEHDYVVAGDPDGSFVYEKIASSNPSDGARMPLSGPLPDADIETIRTWIAEGALDN